MFLVQPQLHVDICANLNSRLTRPGRPTSTFTFRCVTRSRISTAFYSSSKETQSVYEASTTETRSRMLTGEGITVVRHHKAGSVRINTTVRRVRATNFAVEKQ